MRKFSPLLLLLVIAGCSSSLDSGYEPRRLGASDAQRRAFYSSPYSEETQQALEADRFSGPERRVRY
jgi:hypothetical protein